MSALEEWRRKVVAQSAQYAELIMELLRENDRLISENVKLAAENGNVLDDLHAAKERIAELEEQLETRRAG